MIFIVIIIGCILGAILGMNAPMISYTYSSYLAIAVIAALDSVFGGIASVVNKKFDMKIFISGFFGNAILAILLTMLGEKLNVDIYLSSNCSICMENVYEFRNNKKILCRKMDQ